MQDSEGNTTTHYRDRLRPDIMLVQVTDLERQHYTREEYVTPLNPTMPNNACRKVWIVEGGYCSDTRYTDKYKRKETQHIQLQEILKIRGFDVQVLPIILGFSGAIYRSNVTALSILGVERPKAKKLLLKLHAHAVQAQHAIIQLRRRLESMKKHKHRSNISPRNSVQTLRPP